MIDIHCHILWDIDDGPADLAGSLAMARKAAADGTKYLVATPHIGRHMHPPELIADKVTQLNEALRDAEIPLEILAGGDNLYNLGAKQIAPYSINGTRYVLVEFPHTHLPAHASDELFELLSRRFVPIITHPERNPSIIKKPDLLGDMLADGALVQLTAESLTGGFGSASQACARYLLKKGMVHFLASDGHSADWRPPVLSAGLKAAGKIIGTEAARKLVVDNPRKVLLGQDL